MNKPHVWLLSLTFWLFSSSAWAGDVYWVDVSTSLTVRTSPAATSVAVGSLPRKAEVEVLRFVGNTQTVGGRSGRWAEIQAGGINGYVFGGFLKAQTEASTSPDHSAILQRLQAQYPAYYANGLFLVDNSEQRMYWYANDKLVRSYRISTAAKGLGSKAESNQTPAGAHRIASKIGRNAPRGMIFEHLASTGKIAKIYTQPQYGATALVTSRILRLDGLEPGKNKGGNVDTFNRAIYFHGTNKEGNLGKNASHGCIRMNNNEIIALFDQVGTDTLVYIQP